MLIYNKIESLKDKLDEITRIAEKDDAPLKPGIVDELIIKMQITAITLQQRVLLQRSRKKK